MGATTLTTIGLWERAYRGARSPVIDPAGRAVCTAQVGLYLQELEAGADQERAILVAQLALALGAGDEAEVWGALAALYRAEGDTRAAEDAEGMKALALL